MTSKSRKLKARMHQTAKAKKARNASARRHVIVKSPDSEKMPPLRAKPDAFNKFSDVAEYAGHHTYLITRLRKVNAGTRPVTLGSGFLVGPNRLFTCAHVINDLKHPSATLSQHQDGDGYLFIQKSDGELHSHAVRDLIVGQDIFLYPEIDAAIINLPDDFYRFNANLIKNPKNHLLFSENQAPIGSEVGVLGYPMQEVRFSPAGQLDQSSIIMRADKGVINTRFLATSDNTHMYEFTIAFNPGNSGGPILSQETGLVIGWVQGFNSFPIKLDSGSVIWNAYSRGCSSENLKNLAEQHSLAFS